VLIGAWALGRRWLAATLYIVVYSALLLWWPWQRARFIAPALPFLGVAVMLGWGVLAGRWRASAALPAMAVVSGILGLSGLALAGHTIKLANACKRGSSPPADSCISPDQASFFQAAQYIKRELPAGAVLLNAKPEPLFFYSGHQSVAWSKTVREVRAPGAVLTDVLQRAGVSYILLGSLRSSEMALLKVLESHCASIKVAATFPPRTYLFRVVPGSTSVSDSTESCTALSNYRRDAKGRDFGTEQWPPHSGAAPAGLSEN
jgi:hypothetical protein